MEKNEEHEKYIDALINKVYPDYKNGIILDHLQLRKLASVAVQAGFESGFEDGYKIGYEKGFTDCENEIVNEFEDWDEV